MDTHNIPPHGCTTDRPASATAHQHSSTAARWRSVMMSGCTSTHTVGPGQYPPYTSACPSGEAVGSLSLIPKHARAQRTSHRESWKKRRRKTDSQERGKGTTNPDRHGSTTLERPALETINALATDGHGGMFQK